MLRYLILILLATGCEQREEVSAPPHQTITGRSLEAIYRARVPEEWTREDPQEASYFTDTTLPVCSFCLPEAESIRVFVHTFPTENIRESIPAAAQLQRWRRQFTSLDPLSEQTTPIAWGGFSGLQFEASGEIGGKRQRMMAWAMQIAPEHYATLQGSRRDKQMRADWTIKVVGPEPLLEKHKHAITAFAESFELIDPIPMRL